MTMGMGSKGYTISIIFSIILLSGTVFSVQNSFAPGVLVGSTALNGYFEFDSAVLGNPVNAIMFRSHGGSATISAEVSYVTDGGATITNSGFSGSTTTPDLDVFYSGDDLIFVLPPTSGDKTVTLSYTSDVPVEPLALTGPVTPTPPNPWTPDGLTFFEQTGLTSVTFPDISATITTPSSDPVFTQDSTLAGSVTFSFGNVGKAVNLSAGCADEELAIGHCQTARITLNSGFPDFTSILRIECCDLSLFACNCQTTGDD